MRTRVCVCVCVRTCVAEKCECVDEMDGPTRGGVEWSSGSGGRFGGLTGVQLDSGTRDVVATDTPRDQPVEGKKGNDVSYL